MKRFAMVMATAVCATALCVGLVGCGSGGGSASSAAASASASSASSAAASASASASSASASSTAQPTAGVNPADINPGQVTGDSDIWHLDGNASAEGIRFEKADNEAGLAFIRVLANGGDGDGEFNLVITDAQHLRTPLSTAPKIDIVFTDDMNCYDYVTGNWYRRG